MTKNEQNTAIAEACGFKPEITVTSGGSAMTIKNPNSGGRRLIPDYCHDLNAMNEAEKVLTEAQFRNYIFAIHCAWSGNEINHTPAAMRENISATAPQRAESFLRSLGLWKD